jgi:organic radical activating enzyme
MVAILNGQKMNDSYCVLPWLGISVDPDGSIKPCCVSTDFIKKSDGKPYNLGSDDIEDIYNSTDFINIRQSMLAGEKISACDVCHNNEKNNGYSMRLRFNQKWKELTFTDSIAETKIKYFDLRFGNLCNLLCRSCNPKNSSQIQREMQELKHTNILSYVGNSYEQDINQWYHTEIFDKNMENQSENIEWFYITGGEPTLIEKNLEYLEKLIETGRSKSITLAINTNMTNSKSKFYKLLKEFKTVVCSPSIDGYKDMQEYIRYPSNWNQIHDNFKKILDVGPNVLIFPSPVIQITNLGRIVELFEYFEDFNRTAKKCIVDISPIILQHPDHLSISCLPVDYKIECWNQINEWIDSKCKYQGQVFHSRMSSLKSLCYESTTNNKLLDYKIHNTILDEKRNQKLADVNLKLYNLIQFL